MDNSENKNQNYKEKIRKLLALAESDNENEAKSALLKAKRLMAEHKLTEADVRDCDKSEVVRVTTDFTCSKRREFWMMDLSCVIAQNFCCQSIAKRAVGNQTCTVGFLGFAEDVEVCIEIFKYAVDCVRSNIKAIKKKYADCDTSSVKRVCDGYGYGFASGVYEAFAAQMKEDESGWGLVMTVPTEVKEYLQKNHFEKTDTRCAAHQNMARSGFNAGYEDGKKFSPGTKLAAAN
jgi:hypothetical protein